jgi:hypothetical protein
LTFDPDAGNELMTCPVDAMVYRYIYGAEEAEQYRQLLQITASNLHDVSFLLIYNSSDDLPLE